MLPGGLRPPGGAALVLTVAILAPLAACSSTPARDPGTSKAAEEASVEAVRASIEERVGLYDGIATGVIAHVRVGEETAVVAHGRADVKGRVAMSADLTWPIASITKMMTATAVMQLVEEGSLGLDDPADQWLPELSEVGATITVEHLLSHRSGLRDSRDADIKRVGFDSSALLTAAAGHPLEFEPGSRGAYANVGYAALGLLVERITEQPLQRVLQERVFGPAGMSSSALFGRPQVHGYVDGEDYVGRYFLQLQPAAGSVVSTVADVDAFVQALSRGELVGDDTVTDMQTPRGPVGLWGDYGLGVATDAYTCGPAWGHGGRLNGFSSEAWTLEDGSRSVVVVVNDDVSDIVASIVETGLCG